MPKPGQLIQIKPLDKNFIHRDAFLHLTENIEEAINHPVGYHEAMGIPPKTWVMFLEEKELTCKADTELDFPRKRILYKVLYINIVGWVDNFWFDGDY